MRIGAPSLTATLHSKVTDSFCPKVNQIKKVLHEIYTTSKLSNKIYSETVRICNTFMCRSRSARIGRRRRWLLIREARLQLCRVRIIVRASHAETIWTITTIWIAARDITFTIASGRASSIANAQRTGMIGASFIRGIWRGVATPASLSTTKYTLANIK